MNFLNKNEPSPYLFEYKDVCVWEMSLESHKITYLSPTIETISGIPFDTIIQSPSLWQKYIYPEDLNIFLGLQKELSDGKANLYEYRIIRPDGKIRWLMSRTFFKGAEHVFGITINITGLKESEHQLVSSMKNLEVITNALHLTSEVTITDSEGTILYANNKFCELSKYSLEELIGQNHRIIKSGYHDDEVYKAMWETITQGKVWHGEIKNKSKDGSFYWADSTIVPLLDENGTPYQFIAIRKDITKKKEYEETLYELNFHHPLTHLPNGRSIELQLDKLCQKQGDFAVLNIGIDFFKYINNHYGFQTGNQVLIEVSNRLKTIRQTTENIVSHFSGDEFIIVLRDLQNISQAIELAERILQIINTPILLQEESLSVTASIGISLFPTDGKNGVDLIEKAGIALAKGKAIRKNHYHLFQNLMDVESYKKLNLQNDIQTALENNEFFIQYQPKFNTSQKVIGAEALVRWEHPKWGTVSPNEFITIAEETGLIIRLGEWILRSVCYQMMEWKQKGLHLVPISVNFSPIQFSDEKITDFIFDLLKETKVNPKLLDFEITENIIFDSYEDVLQKMVILKQKGIRFSIDDFGTGYSSLKTLKQLNFDQLKIDRSFIKDIQSSADSLQITKATIQLAHQLDMKVVAEGVENKKQFDILQEHHCDYIQGYYLSKPLLAKDFEALITHGKLGRADTFLSLKKTVPNRRQFFRILFKYPLLGSLTIHYLHDKHVSIGSSSILIEDIGAGGLCYVSNIKFPINKEIILGITTTLFEKDLSLQGKNVWCKSLDDGLFQYGFKFNPEEFEKYGMVPLMDQLKLEYNKELLLPDCSFIKITDRAQFFHH
ncbi:EAL domain-containing protein [Bacillus tuaregi]|uniref:EAL domain-containing protein n=1 Tax=Bacillus tuaregi TaxID=1816695 RepID=UPI0008F93037|nr:EAL domain-containing protein [Bacillus tuaregi]